MKTLKDKKIAKLTHAYNADNGEVNKKIQEYILPMSIGAAIVSLSALSEAATPGSVGVISEVMKSITELIKTEGKIGLQILSAAAGGLAAAKTVSWQPLLVGAGGAGIIEVLFQAIK